MAIERYTPAMAADLAAVYNRAVEDVPHCYPVSVERFSDALACAADGGESPDGLRCNAAWVAAEAGGLAGYVHAALGRTQDEQREDRGVLRFLWYRPGNRRAGQALLDTAEQYLREHGMSQVEAFPQHHIYPFYYTHCAYLSDRMGHVGAILKFNGYTPCRGEVFLDWPDFVPAEPQPADIPAEVCVEWKDGRGSRPNATVKAHHGGKEVGACICESLGQRHSADEAQDWFLVEWLGVAEEARGRGLGRHLLQRAMVEMRGAGYRHATISTAWDNYRAFLLYSNYGFHVVDCTYGLRRQLP